MIYQEQFNRKSIAALHTLIEELNWDKDCLDCLIACMKLLSDFKYNRVYRRANAGYLLIHKTRWNQIKYSIIQVRRMKPDEQILQFIKLFNPYCRNLDDVMETVFGVPAQAEDDALMVNTSVQFLPEYAGKYPTKGEIKNRLQGIINGYRTLA